MLGCRGRGKCSAVTDVNRGLIMDWTGQGKRCQELRNWRLDQQMSAIGSAAASERYMSCSVAARRGMGASSGRINVSRGLLTDHAGQGRCYQVFSKEQVEDGIRGGRSKRRMEQEEDGRGGFSKWMDQEKIRTRGGWHKRRMEKEKNGRGGWSKRRREQEADEARGGLKKRRKLDIRLEGFSDSISASCAAILVLICARLSRERHGIREDQGQQRIDMRLDRTGQTMSGAQKLEIRLADVDDYLSARPAALLFLICVRLFLIRGYQASINVST